MAPEVCRLIAECRLSLRESSATFAERKATISTTLVPLGLRLALISSRSSGRQLVPPPLIPLAKLPAKCCDDDRTFEDLKRKPDQ